MRSNWRPLVSYTANLQRVGSELLDAEQAMVKLVSVFETNMLRQRGGRPGPSTAERVSAQPPWYWSAGVLAGLFGISLCVLTTRVKSLDRLK